MKTTVPSKIVASFTLPLLLIAVATHAMAATAALLKAKEEAKSKGYIFFASRDEIVARAKKEGKLRVNSGTEPATYKPLVNAFRQKYPFMTDIRLEEIQGDEAYQRFILEIKSGLAQGWDTTHVPMHFAGDYIPYMKKYDILGMANYGILKIHPGMIHPVARNIMGYTSTIQLVAYNRRLLTEDRVPTEWEEFLKPEFKGRKFVVDIRSSAIAALVPAWGLERTLEFSRKLAAQEPIWTTRAGTRMLTSVSAGEYALFLGPNYNSTKRLEGRDKSGNLGYKIVEPIPIRTVARGDSILPQAEYPHAALLWLEFLASPEGQQILDKYEPLKASIYTPGSEAERITRGKKLSAVDWNHFSKIQDYDAEIQKAFGFPQADK